MIILTKKSLVTLQLILNVEMKNIVITTHGIVIVAVEINRVSTSLTQTSTAVFLQQKIDHCALWASVMRAVSLQKVTPVKENATTITRLTTIRHLGPRQCASVRRVRRVLAVMMT